MSCDMDNFLEVEQRQRAWAIEQAVKVTGGTDMASVVILARQILSYVRFKPEEDL